MIEIISYMDMIQRKSFLLLFMSLLGIVLILKIVYENKIISSLATFPNSNYQILLIGGVSITSYKLLEIIYDSLNIKSFKLITSIHSLEYINFLTLSGISCLLLLTSTVYSENTQLLILSGIQYVFIYIILCNSSQFNLFTISSVSILFIVTNTKVILDSINYINHFSYILNKFSFIIMIANLCFQFYWVYINININQKVIDSNTKGERNINLLIKKDIGLAIYFVLKTIISFYSMINQNSRSIVNLSNLLLLCYLFQLIISKMNCTLALRLIQKNDELKAKTEFIRVITHEIRSPLSTVNLGIEMLIENTNKQLDNTMANSKFYFHEVDETLRDIKISVDVALSNINDLLSLDKIKSNMMSLEKSKVCINDFILHCVRPFKIQAKAVEVSIVYDNYSNDIVNNAILIDSIRMEQVLRNFLSNALKFSPPNSRLQIIVTALNSFTSKDEEGKEKAIGPLGAVRISVIDQGYGITKENQKKLFGQYVQIDPHKLQNGKGSGLGLWLSKCIVDLHDGMIGVESFGEGLGSTFYVELPLYPPIRDELKLPSVTDLTVARAMAKNISTLNLSQSDISDEILRRENSISQANAYSQYSQTILSMSKGNIIPNSTLPSVVNSRSNSARYNTPNTSSPRATNYKSLPIDITSVMNNLNISNQRFLNSNDNIATKKLNILVVDDAALGRKMIQKILSEIYYVCGQAKDGLEAYEIVKSNLNFYDVVLIDYNMPKMNGPEAIKLMRELNYNGVILGVTGSVDPMDEQNFMNSGADAVITKPLSLENFRAILRSLTQVSM